MTVSSGFPIVAKRKQNATRNYTGEGEDIQVSLGYPLTFLQLRQTLLQDICTYAAAALLRLANGLLLLAAALLHCMYTYIYDNTQGKLKETTLKQQASD